MEELSVYILAGGKSSRMGTDKGLLTVSGKRMVQHIIDTVLPLTSNISIVSNNKAYESFGYPVIHDLIKDKGPVGGIYSALSDSAVDLNLILSCDTPFVSQALIKKLINYCKDVDVCIPSFNGRIHPIIGVYRKRNTKFYKNGIDEGQLKLMALNEKLNTLILNTDAEFKEKEFVNFNTKKELNKYV